ncbi:MAG: YerC/YecD family TrpR-related protein [Bacillota bacterium]
MYFEKLPEKGVHQLFHAILSLNSIEECMAFFDDLCTINEIKSFCQRLEVARRLCEGDTYEEIVLELHATTATISRVNKSLNQGNGALKMVLDRIESTK